PEPAPALVYTLSLHDALPICRQGFVRGWRRAAADENPVGAWIPARLVHDRDGPHDRAEPQEREVESGSGRGPAGRQAALENRRRDRKSTRLNSSHVAISYAVL